MRKTFQDVAYFFRAVGKAPWFFALAVLTLALGIGANTAIFSVINSVLLRPLPFHEPDRLVRLFETEAAPGRYPFAGPDYLDWQAQNKTLEASALFTWFRRTNVSGGGEPESASVVQAESSFFSVLGVGPLLGRTFGRGEGASGGARVAVLSFGFWQRHFGGDAAVLSRRIELDAEPYTVVGVMPSWFNYPRNTEIWTPLDMSPQNLGSRGNHSYLAVARLKTGISAAQAQADLQVIAGRLEAQYPDSNEKVGAAVVPMREQLTGSSREPLLILLGAVTLVLLVACANVANLLLIRAGSRRRELAIRGALGAGRRRLVRQLLTESLLLALAGAVAGLAFAWWAVRLLQSVETLPIPLVNPVRIDLAVLLFTLGAAVVTGLLFGILPALQASGLALSEELKAGGQGVPGGRRGTRRWRDAIAVAEIAVSLALLVGAGLLLRSFDALRRAEVGVDPRGVLTLAVQLPAKSYATLTARRSFYDRLLARVRAVPGVQAVAASTLIPLEGGSNGYITVPGRDDAALANQLFEWNYTTNDYLRAFGIPLVQGRGFTSRDDDEAAEAATKLQEVFASPEPRRERLRGLSVATVINRTMARLLWPGQDPVGKTFVLGGVLNARVVGVTADARVRGIRGESLPQAHFPFVASLDDAGSRILVVKGTVPPATLLAPVRACLAELDPTLAVIQPRTMDDVIADAMQDTRLQASLLVTFAALAAILAAVGLYSVMAFLVAQRTREIGIRLALGAHPRDLVRLVLRHAAALILAGVVAGVAGALWLVRLLRSLLYGVGPADPATFVAVSGLLVLIALAACIVPARRAVRVDPLVAFRCE